MPRIFFILDRACESSSKTAAETNKNLIAEHVNLTEQLFLYQQKYIQVLRVYHKQEMKLIEMERLLNQQGKELTETKNGSLHSDLINFSDSELVENSKFVAKEFDGIEQWANVNIPVDDPDTLIDIVSGSISFTADVRDLILFIVVNILLFHFGF